MKNKKGFTLVELLAVITILALIVVLATTSIISINDSMKEKMLEEKYEIIEEAAVLYGQNFKNSILQSTKFYYTNKDGNYVKTEHRCITVPVKELIDTKMIDKDNTDDCVSTDTCVIDPTDDTKYLDNLEVVIYAKNNRRIQSKMKDSTRESYNIKCE